MTTSEQPVSPSSPVAMQPSRPARPLMAVAFAAALAIRLPLMTQPGFGGDLMQFVMWADRASHLGVASLYERRPDGRRVANYPPGYLYVLSGVARLHDAAAPAEGRLSIQTFGEVGLSYETPAARRAYFFFKLPGVLADALTAMLLVALLWRRAGPVWSTIAGAGYALVPATWHHSAAWGQMDGLVALLLVASLEAARRGRMGWFGALAAASLLTKAQAAMLAPLWAVIVIRAGLRDRQAAARAVAAAVVVVAALLWPVRGRLEGVWEAYAGAAGFYPFTHVNGFSAWFALHPIAAPDLARMAQVYARDDAPGPAGLTPRAIGLAALMLIWIYTLVVLWRSRRAAGPPPVEGDSTRAESAASAAAQFDADAWAARLLPLAFFVVSTQMHERYLFCALALWAWAWRPGAAWAIGAVVLAGSITINQWWVWPGPAEGWLTEAAAAASRGPWLGVSVGTICAAANGAVLAWALYEPWRRRASSQGRTG